VIELALFTYLMGAGIGALILVAIAYVNLLERSVKRSQQRPRVQVERARPDNVIDIAPAIARARKARR
jgi:type II secretory pathway component PulM